MFVVSLLHFFFGDRLTSKNIPFGVMLGNLSFSSEIYL